MADLQGRLPLTAPPATHTLLHSQRQLFPDHTNTSQDKRQICEENQAEDHTHELNAVTATTSGNTPRPAGVTTKAYSPFPDAEVAESYMSEESESQEESGGEEDDESVYRDQGVGGVGHTHVPNRTGQVRDQFETSPEPHSLQSSITENIIIRSKNFLKQQHARSRPSRSQRHRNRLNISHPLVQVRYYDDPETQGTFTSAPSTPASQQRVLVMQSGSNGGVMRPHTADGEVTPHSNAGTHFDDQEVGSHFDIESHYRAEELRAHSNEGEIGSQFNADGIDSHSEGEQSSDEFDSEGERVTDQETVFKEENEDSETSVVGPGDPQEEVLDEERQFKSPSDGGESTIERTAENVTKSGPQEDEHPERELNPEPDPTQLQSDSDQQQNDPLLSSTGSHQTGIDGNEENGTDNNELGEGGDEMVFQVS